MNIQLCLQPPGGVPAHQSVRLGLCVWKPDSDPRLLLTHGAVPNASYTDLTNLGPVPGKGILIPPRRAGPFRTLLAPGYNLEL